MRDAPIPLYPEWMTITEGETWGAGRWTRYEGLVIFVPKDQPDLIAVRLQMMSENGQKEFALGVIYWLTLHRSRVDWVHGLPDVPALVALPDVVYLVDEYMEGHL